MHPCLDQSLLLFLLSPFSNVLQLFFFFFLSVQRNETKVLIMVSGLSHRFNLLQVEERTIIWSHIYKVAFPSLMFLHYLTALWQLKYLWYLPGRKVAHGKVVFTLRLRKQNLKAYNYMSYMLWTGYLKFHSSPWMSSGKPGNHSADQVEEFICNTLS